MFNNSSVSTQLTASSCSSSVVDSTVVKGIKYVVFSTIMITALLGNSFIIAVVYRKKSMRKTTNMFIANMAASDLFIAVVIIPRVIVELYTGPGRWMIEGTLGVITCKFSNFFADFSVCVTLTSHAVIAIDRFWAIVYSLRSSPITPARRKYIIALIWLYSFILHSPNLHIYKLSHKRGQTFCIINWYPLDNFTSQKTFFSVILVFVVCIPVLLMTVLYTWLIVSLNSKGILSTQNSHGRQQRQKEDVIVLRKVVVLLTVFLFSSLPITVLGILQYYFWEWQLPCSAWVYAFLAYVLLLSNSAVNPWLCIVLHESYSFHVRKMLLCNPRLDAAKRNGNIEECELKTRSLLMTDRVCTTSYKETVDHCDVLCSSMDQHTSLCLNDHEGISEEISN